MRAEIHGADEGERRGVAGAAGRGTDGGCRGRGRGEDVEGGATAGERGGQGAGVAVGVAR